MTPYKIPGFTGINNRISADRLPRDDAGNSAVPDAVNVDLSGEKSFQRRPGYALALALPNCRDLHAVMGGALVASADNLYMFDGATATSVASLPSSSTRIAYVDTPLGVVWSDGASLNLFDGTSRRLAPPPPNPTPVVSVIGGGSLVAGTYGIRFATLASDGRQSPLSNPIFVTVGSNGSIQLTTPAQQEGVAVFVTAVDGSTFYREATIAAGQTGVSIPSIRSNGQPVSAGIVGALPAGQMLALHGGRLLSARGSVLTYSQPWAMGLYRPASDYIWLGRDIELIVPVAGGVYIADAATTYFLAGADIADAKMVPVAPYGAVRGTAVKDPTTTDMLWHSPRGPVRGSDSGEVELLQDSQIAYPRAVSGASIVRESNGLRHLITTLSGAQPTGSAVFGSYMDARVITGNTP